MYWALAFSLLMTVGAIASAIGNKTLPDKTVRSPADWGPWAEGPLIAVLWGPIFVVPGIIAVRRYRRVRMRRLLGWKDLQERRIELVELNDEPYTTIEGGRVGRFYIFDMPDAGALCLAMHNHFWLQRSERIVEELEEEIEDYSDDDVEKVLLRQLPVFPARSFQVHRWPSTGVIVDIRTLGVGQEAEDIIALCDVPPGVAKHLVHVWDRDSTFVHFQRGELR